MRARDFFVVRRELSIAEVLALLTPLSIAASGIYNFGYFLSLDPAYLGLLSVQDLAIGAAIAFVPLGAAIHTSWRLAGFAVSLREAERNRWLIPAVAVGCAVVTALIFAFTDKGWTYSTFPVFIFILIAYAVSSKKFGWRWFEEIVTVVSVSFMCFTTGQSNYELLFSAPQMNSRILMSNGREVDAVVLRATSGYLFIHNGTSAQVLPINGVTRIQQTGELVSING